MNPNGYLTFETKNLLVPAFGNTRCLLVEFPFNSSNVFDFKQIVIEDVPFIPQSVTIDATDVPEAETVTFVVQQINFTRIIQGGQNVTFNFPSIQNLKVSVTSSDAVSSVRAYFYNYPAFVDFQGAQQVQIAGASGSGTLPVEIVAPDPVNVAIVSGGGASSIVKDCDVTLLTGAVTTAQQTMIFVAGAYAIHSIMISGLVTVDVNTILNIYDANGSANSLARIPLITGKDNNIQLVLQPAIPIQIPSGIATVYAFSANATITGTLAVTISYESPLV